MRDLNRPEPAPQRNDRPAVWDLVVADMHARDASGLAKYGTRLQPHNGRDALVDMYQDLLDAVAYTRQRIEEERSAREPQPGSVREQIAALIDGASEEDAQEIARLESELRASRRSLEHAQAECNALLAEGRTLRAQLEQEQKVGRCVETNYGRWMHELWRALGGEVASHTQAIARVHQLTLDAAKGLKALAEAKRLKRELELAQQALEVFARSGIVAPKAVRTFAVGGVLPKTDGCRVGETADSGGNLAPDEAVPALLRIIDWGAAWICREHGPRPLTEKNCPKCPPPADTGTAPPPATEVRP